MIRKILKCELSARITFHQIFETSILLFDSKGIFSKLKNVSEQRRKEIPQQLRKLKNYYNKIRNAYVRRALFQLILENIILKILRKALFN